MPLCVSLREWDGRECSVVSAVAVSLLLSLRFSLLFILFSSFLLFSLLHFSLLAHATSIERHCIHRETHCILQTALHNSKKRERESVMRSLFFGSGLCNLTLFLSSRFVSASASRSSLVWPITKPVKASMLPLRISNNSRP